MSLNRILVPLDFSEPSELAARFALALGGRHHAEIFLLHVDEVPEYVSRMAERVRADVWEGYLRERNYAVRRQLEQFTQSLPSFPGKLNQSIARGEPVEEINAFAAAQRPDLVVVTPNGTGSGKHFGAGSVSMHLAARCAFPVLVIRPDSALAASQPFAFRRPLLVTGASEPEAVALEWVARLAMPNAHVDVVCRGKEDLETRVALPEYEAYLGETARSRRAQVAKLLQALKHQGFNAQERTTPGETATVALEAQAARDNDLIIVTRPSVGRDRRQVVLAERIAGHASVPVLLLPIA